MKNVNYSSLGCHALYLVSMVVTLLVSCEKGTISSYTGITLRPNKESMDGASEIQFVEGDQVGVFVVRYSGLNSPGTLGVTNFATNIKFQCDADNRFIPDSIMNWYTVSEGQSSKSDFYAYYPYSANLDLTKLESISFSVMRDQSRWSDYTKSDLMCARALAQTPKVDGVRLDFKHTMARFIINVKATSGAFDPSKLVVKFKNVCTKLTWNLSAMCAVNCADVADIIPCKLETPSSGYDVSCAVIIPPQLITSDLVEFVYDDGGPILWAPFTETNSNYILSSGKQYSKNIELNIPRYSGITLRASKIAMEGASETQFVEGDQVGVFVVRYSGLDSPGTFGETNFVTNVKFQCDADNRFIPDSIMNWYTVSEGQSSKSDFYAYYPYSANMNLTKLESTSFSVMTDQSRWSDYTI